MRYIRGQWLSIIAMVASVAALVMAGTMYWSYGKQDSPETHELTIHLVSRSDVTGIGEECHVDVGDRAQPVARDSSQLIVENSGREIIGEASLNNGEIRNQNGSEHCVKTVTLEIEESDFYLFSVYGWYQRTERLETLEESNWEIQLFLDW